MAADRDDDESTKWDFAESVLRNKSTQEIVPSNGNHVTATVIGVTNTVPKGVVENWKAGRIDRDHRLVVLQETKTRQLQVFKTYIAGQAEVAEARIHMTVQQQLDHISNEYLEHLRQSGIANVEGIAQALYELNIVTARELQRTNAADVPPYMKEKTLDAIKDSYDKLFDRIKADEIRPHARAADSSTSADKK